MSDINMNEWVKAMEIYNYYLSLNDGGRYIKNTANKFGLNEGAIRSIIQSVTNIHSHLKGA